MKFKINDAVFFEYAGDTEYGRVVAVATGVITVKFFRYGEYRYKHLNLSSYYNPVVCGKYVERKIKHWWFWTKTKWVLELDADNETRN